MILIHQPNAEGCSILPGAPCCIPGLLGMDVCFGASGYPGAERMAVPGQGCRERGSAHGKCGFTALVVAVTWEEQDAAVDEV